MGERELQNCRDRLDVRFAVVTTQGSLENCNVFTLFLFLFNGHFYTKQHASVFLEGGVRESLEQLELRLQRLNNP